jgi:hypothetical protein
MNSNEEYVLDVFSVKTVNSLSNSQNTEVENI